MPNKIEKYIEERPWGKFEQFVANQKCTVKIITINPGQTLSLQYHDLRDEFWHVLQGPAFIIIGGETYESAHDGDEFFIPRKTLHRIGALITNIIHVKILEIAFGKFDETDIVRVADNYGRV